jgi:hypothetical protein
MSGNLGRREAIALDRIDHDGDGLQPGAVGVCCDQATQSLGGAQVEITRLAGAEQDQPAEIRLAQDRKRLALGAGEAARLDGARESAARTGIDRLGGDLELLVGADKDRDIAGEGLRKGRKLHFHSVPL